MAFCKRAPGAGLQILLKPNRLPLAWKLERYHEGPGTMHDCMARQTPVVPFNAIADIIGNPNIVSQRFAPGFEGCTRSASLSHSFVLLTHRSRRLQVRRFCGGSLSRYAALAMSRGVRDGRTCHVLRLRGFAASARQVVLESRPGKNGPDTEEPVSPKLAPSASEGGASHHPPPALYWRFRVDDVTCD